MNQTLFKKAMGLMTALAMFLLLAAGTVPVNAADTMKVTATTLPSTVEAGESFALQVSITGSQTTGKTAEVTVSGLGGLSGSCTVSGVSFDGSGKAAFTTPAGNITYSGSDTTAIMVQVGGETATVNLSSFIPKEDSADDTPITPSKPTGNVFAIKEGTPLPTLKAGESQTISLPLVNTTSRRYTDVQFTLELPTGLYVNGASFSQKITFSGRATEKLNIPLSVTASTESGVYQAKVTATYKYSSESVTESFDFNIKVTGSTGQTGEGRLTVVNYSINPGTVSAGSNFKLVLTVKNTGSSTIKDTAVTLGGLSTDAFTMNNSLDTQYISTLDAGTSTNLTFNLCAAAGMTTGNYILDISMAAGELTGSAKVFIPVQGSGSSGGTGANEGKPQVIIESYTYGEEGATSVIGGQVFTLTMKIKNAGKVAIENVKMTVSSAADETTGGAFSPANSSNTFFIQSIPAGGTIEKSIDLLPKADAAPKSYGMAIAFNYEAMVNGERIEMNPTETISIPLTQPDRFEIGELQMWGPVMAGETLSGYVNYVNKGKSTIFNLSVKIEGEGFTTAESESYIGNVESGAGDSFEPSLNTNQAGPITGRLIFSYEDANGEVKEVIKEFESEAMENTPVDPMPEIPTDVIPEENGMPVWGWIAIAGGGAVVAIIVIVVVVKVIKKKKQKALDAEDDYDDEDLK